MTENLQHIIRQWCHRGDDTPSVPIRPTDNCLSFQAAECIATGEMQADARLKEHLAECEHCRRLVACFQEVLDEGMVDVPSLRPVSRKIRWWRPALALAASIVIAIGAGLWLSTQKQATPNLLAHAEVGLQEQIESGMVIKGRTEFSSGQVIMFQIQLREPCHVTILSLDPVGKITPLPPISSKSNFVQKFPAGTAKLGLYRLDNTVGLETFFIIALEEDPVNLEGRVSKLQAEYNRGLDVEQIAEKIRAWGGDVKTISFNHTSPD